MSHHTPRGRFFASMMLVILVFVTGCQNLATETPATTPPQTSSIESPVSQETESPVVQTEDEGSLIETESPPTA
ncbi:MAG TPA: hypothetical protein DF984_01725, partial [Anaerolineaceae bacterium]|nr:hypothetical protein [Anaerolineaceae bacterium]